MAMRRRGKAWFVTVEMGRDATTGKRRRVHLTVPTRREAEQEEARLRHQAATGLDLEPSRLTLADYLERWLGAASPNLAPATSRRYEGLLRHQVIPHVGAILLSKLRPLHVQQLYAQLRGAGRVDGKGGISPRTLLHVHRVLSEALAHAVELQFLARNPADAVKPPRAGRRELRVLNPQEVTRLLDAARSTASYGPMYLALTTGIRLGELLALRWEDVDLDRATIHITRSALRFSSQGVTFRDTKTHRSRRAVALSPYTVALLREHRRFQVTRRLALGPAYQDHDLVFASSTGKPMEAANLRRALGRAAQKAGVTNLRLHDLRHTAATLMLRAGVHPKVVSERLGHASVGLTLDIYSHVLPDMQRDAADAMDALLSPALSSSASAKE